MSSPSFPIARRTKSLPLDNDDYHLQIVSPWMAHRTSNYFSSSVPANRPADFPRHSSCYVPGPNSDFSSSLPRCSVGKFRKEGERVVWNPYNKNTRYGLPCNVYAPLQDDPISPRGIVFSSQRTPSISSDLFAPSNPQPRLNFDISTVLKQAEMYSKPPTPRSRRRFSLASLLRKSPEPKSAPIRSSTLDGYAGDIFMRSATDYQPPKPKKHRFLRRKRSRKHRGQMLLESPSRSAPPPQSHMLIREHNCSVCSAPAQRTDKHVNEYDRKNDDLYLKFMRDYE